MKKIYQNPETIVAELSMMSQLLANTPQNKVTKVGGGTLGYGGFNTSDARTKEYNSWDDWEE